MERLDSAEDTATPRWRDSAGVQRQDPAGSAPAGDRVASRLLERWATANPTSARLDAEARRVLPDGLAHDVRRSRPFPLSVVSAHGSTKRDADGHEVLCYVMGHGSLLFGHGDPDVVGAVADQAATYLHAGACHRLEAAWASEISRLLPSAEQVRFTSSGTEATLLALQIARAQTGRHTILKLDGHFHGWHDYAAFGVKAPFSTEAPSGIPAPLGGLVRVVPPDLERIGEELGAADVAAVILEPTGAAWGAIPLPEEFLAGLRSLTRAHGTQLVFDEVVSGFRWSPGGVQQLTGVTPDLTALGKIVAGGLPGGAVAGRHHVMEQLSFDRGPVKVSHPGTHNCHPLSAAAGVATLRKLGDPALHQQLDARAATLRQGLNDAFSRVGVPGLAYGSSSTFCLLFGEGLPGPDEPLLRRVPPERLKAGVTGPLYDALHCGMLLEGVHLFHGCGFLSAAHSDNDTERTAAAFEATLRQLGAEGLV